MYFGCFLSLNGITTQNTSKVSSALTNGYGCPLWKLLCVGNKLRKWGPVKFYTLCHRNAPMNFVLLVVCWLIRRKIFFKFFIFCPNSVEWNSCCCFIFMFTTGKLNSFSAEFFSSPRISILLDNCIVKKTTNSQILHLQWNILHKVCMKNNHNSNSIEHYSL